MSSTVLIASPEHLQILKEREDLANAQAFSDAEALRALDVITRQRPDVVALERLFASTSRGTALINRIKADPSLAACEIRIVAHDSEPARSASRPAQSAAEAAVAVVEAPPAAPAKAPLDQRGTRRAPRFKIVDGVEVSIDGNPAVAAGPVGRRRAGRVGDDPAGRTSACGCHCPTRTGPSASAGGWHGPRSRCRKAARATAPASSSSTPTPWRVNKFIESNKK